MSKKIIVAIDGFSSCGKSTMAKMLAKEVGYRYIDTGAMYRTVGLFASQNGLLQNGIVDELGLHAKMNELQIDFVVNAHGQSETTLNGVNVEAQIRSLDAAAGASLVSQLAFVREAMVKQQKMMGKDKGIVMDGRDIGTVVFPEAELKIFVTASSEVRAKRRFDELIAKGDVAEFDEVLHSTIERDERDVNRKESPLRAAPDALVLDNSNIGVEEQKNWLFDQFYQKVNA